MDRAAVRRWSTGGRVGASRCRPLPPGPVEDLSFAHGVHDDERSRRGGTMAKAKGTKDDPWVLKTPPGSSEYAMYRDDESDPPTIVCQVGSTKLGYQARCIEDLHAMLKKQ